MTDDFIASLKADWDRQDAEATLVRLRGQRWRPHVLLVAELLGTIAMLLFGLLFATIALKLNDLLLTLSAAAMLSGLPFVITGLRLRMATLAWDGESPEGVLRSSLHRLSTTQRTLKLGVTGAAILLALVVIVWAAHLMELVREPRSSLLTITTVWLLTGLGVLVWIKWRLARVRRAIVGCHMLLRQFERFEGEASN